MPDLHQENKVFSVSAIRNIFSGLLDVLYPRHCFACDKSLHEETNTYVCENCLEIPLGSLLVNLLHQKTICEIDLVVPVPLHWKKKQERGFNQSELMAKKISKILSIPISTSNLFQAKNTLSQTQLSRTQRQKNVKGAFKVKIQKRFIKRIYSWQTMF